MKIKGAPAESGWGFSDSHAPALLSLSHRRYQSRRTTESQLCSRYHLLRHKSARQLQVYSGPAISSALPYR
jgi:hypothetical protein